MCPRTSLNGFGEKKISCCYRNTNPGPSSPYLFVDYAIQAPKTMYSQTNKLGKAGILKILVVCISGYFGIYAVTTFTWNIFRRLRMAVIELASVLGQIPRVRCRCVVVPT